MVKNKESLTKSDYRCESTPVKTAIILDNNGNQVEIPFEDSEQLLKDNFECFITITRTNQLASMLILFVL